MNKTEYQLKLATMLKDSTHPALDRFIEELCHEVQFEIYPLVGYIDPKIEYTLGSIIISLGWDLPADYDQLLCYSNCGADESEIALKIYDSWFFGAIEVRVKCKVCAKYPEEVVNLLQALNKIKDRYETYRSRTLNCSLPF